MWHYHLDGSVQVAGTEAGSSIKIHLQTLDTQQESCNNNADRSYVENTAYTYEGLNQCLAGAPIPEDSPVDYYTTSIYN